METHRREDKHRSLAKRTHEKLMAMSFQDSLTSLLNRRGYELKFNEFYSLAKRTGDSLQIIIIDVDGFKRINERYSHAGGDSALKTVASAINETFRDIDAKARWGGDEFVILALNRPGSQMIPEDEITQRLNSKINELRPPMIGDGELRVTLGVVAWDGNKTKEDLFAEVDNSMLSRKKNG